MKTLKKHVVSGFNKSHLKEITSTWGHFLKQKDTGKKNPFTILNFFWKTPWVCWCAMPPCQAGHIFPQDAFGFVVGRRADPWPLRAEYAAVRGLQIDLETGQARLLLARPSAMAAPLFSLEAWQYAQPSGDVMWCAATSSGKVFWCSSLDLFGIACSDWMNGVEVQHENIQHLCSINMYPQQCDFVRARRSSWAVVLDMQLWHSHISLWCAVQVERQNDQNPLLRRFPKRTLLRFWHWRIPNHWHWCWILLRRILSWPCVTTHFLGIWMGQKDLVLAVQVLLSNLKMRWI